ncbi:hypothetical protein BaRGS_00007219 [Batillaria attramentaria]|uniref:Uncharacterized protein n=1 Tax=Batillaria attramentaria TaxID=370345 RepID=A0ABD0LPM3_9CAEN
MEQYTVQYSMDMERNQKTPDNLTHANSVYSWELESGMTGGQTKRLFSAAFISTRAEFLPLIPTTPHNTHLLFLQPSRFRRPQYSSGVSQPHLILYSASCWWSARLKPGAVYGGMLADYCRSVLRLVLSIAVFFTVKFVSDSGLV